MSYVHLLEINLAGHVKCFFIHTQQSGGERRMPTCPGSEPMQGTAFGNTCSCEMCHPYLKAIWLMVSDARGGGML